MEFGTSVSYSVAVSLSLRLPISKPRQRLTPKATKGYELYDAESCVARGVTSTHEGAVSILIWLTFESA